jgi:hypothetical protein
VTLWLAAYCQSVHLSIKPLEDHDQKLSFPQLNPYGHSPYVTLSLTRRWVCLLWTCLAFHQAYVSHIACYWKFFILHTIPLSVWALQNRLCLSYASNSSAVASCSCCTDNAENTFFQLVQPSNRCCLQSHYLAMGLHATLSILNNSWELAEWYRYANFLPPVNDRRK